MIVSLTAASAAPDRVPNQSLIDTSALLLKEE